VKVGDSDALDDETIDAGQLAPLREFAPSTFSTKKQNTEQVKKSLQIKFQRTKYATIKEWQRWQ